MPVIGVMCCNIQLDAPHHTVFEQYVDELAGLYDFTPVLVPAFRLDLRDRLNEFIARTVDRVDGILLPGSPTNVHPRFYNEEAPKDVEQTFDLRRDYTSLALINQAIRAGCPILGICRGMQELNVALGGSLTWVPSIRSKVESATRARHDDTALAVRHTAKDTEIFSDKYQPVHRISLSPDGVIRRLLNERTLTFSEYDVNSLHRQCVARLGSGLMIEASAEDGVVEAISLDSYPSFCLGVQWHPEWFSENDSLNKALFEAFLTACRFRHVSNGKESVLRGVVNANT